MAETSREDQTELVSTINEWLVDFALHSTWEEFHSIKNIENRDFIQGILCRPLFDAGSRVCQVQLILIMCKLADGQEFGTQYTLDSDMTVLEEVLDSFNCLVNGFHRMSIIGTEAAAYRLALLTQAVYVCCRAGDFNIAQDVFDRQKEEIKKEDQSHWSVVQAVIKSKKTDHKQLLTYSYEKFLDVMVVFLQLVMDTFPEPFLFKLARSYKESCGSGDNRDKKRCQSINVIQQLETLNDIAMSEDEAASPNNQHLRKTRDQVVAKVVTSVMADVNNSNANDPASHGRTRSTSLTRGEKIVTATKESRMKLQKRTRTLRNTIQTIMMSGSPSSRSQSQSSDTSPEKGPSKTSRKGRSTSSTTSGEGTSGSSKGIRKFRYKKNRHRADRHLKHDPPDHHDNSNDQLEVTMETGSGSDDDDAMLNTVATIQTLRMTQCPKVRKSLDYVSTTSKGSKHVKKSSKREFWTQREEIEFVKATRKLGEGNWAEIRTYLKSKRTSVNLKDKWRQLHRSGRIDEFKKM